jgi:hypothetical protein
MKRREGSALNAPKVTIHTDNPACPLVISVGLGSQDPRRDVGLFLYKRAKAELFLVCDIGTKGRKTWMQWHARILPEQLDNLISCLTVARKESAKRGLIGKEAKTA